MSLRSLLLLLGVSCAITSSGCPGAQQKAEAAPVEVKLRRVAVAEGSYDRLLLNVIAVVENEGSTDVVVSGADASLAIVGEAVEGAQDEADEEAADEGEDGEGEDGEGEDGEEEEEGAAEDEEGGAGDEASAAPAAAQRFTGRASGGSAPAFKTSEVVIPVEVKLPSDPAELERLLSWEKAVVDVNGSLTIGGRTETFGGRREIAPPHLPKVVLQEAQVASVDGGESGAGFFRIALDNKNPFEVVVDRFAWSIAVGGKELRPLGEGMRESVPPSSVATFEDTVAINEAAFGPDLKTLLKQPSVPYTVEGFIEVKGIKKPFTFSGDMQFAR